MANLEIAGAHKRTQKGNVDYYYGGDNEAWADLAAAKAGVPSSIRPGKTVGVYISGKIVEHWWPDATHIADSDLQPILTAGAVGLGVTDSLTISDVTTSTLSVTGPSGMGVSNLGVSGKVKIGGMDVTNNGGLEFADSGASATVSIGSSKAILGLSEAHDLVIDVKANKSFEVHTNASKGFEVLGDGTVNGNGGKLATTANVATAVAAANHYRGKYASLSALQTAIPTGADGDYAIVTGSPNDQEYIWDSDHTAWTLTANIPAGTFAGLGGSPTDNGALAAALGAKVDTVSGYGLISSTDQTKLNSIASGATANSAATLTDAQAGTEASKFIVPSILAGWWTWIKTQAATIAGAWNFTGGLQSGGNAVETQNNKATDFTIVDNNKYPTTAAVRADKLVSFNDQTGTTYTLALTDANKKIRMSNASANVVTIPTNATVAFLVGTTIRVQMAGVGNTSIVGASGVTVHGYTQVIDVQYNEALLFKEATDTWSVIGIAPDVSAVDGPNGTIKNVPGTNTIDFKAKVLQASGLGGCLSLNAANSQYVDIPTTNFSGVNVDFSVSVLLKTTQTTGGFFRLAYSTGFAVLGGFSGNAVEFGQSGGSSYTGTKTINDGNWHLWIVTYSASSRILSCYVDNSLVGTSSNLSNNCIMNSDIVRIGMGVYAGNGYYFTGQIAQCLIYSSVLSSTDRGNIWNSGNFTNTPPTTNLIRSYQFQDASGTTVADNNPNTTQYAATLNNGPIWQGPGNGAISQGATTSSTTYLEVLDGAIAGERGQVKTGDVLCGNIQQGRSVKTFINNYWPLIQDFSGKVLINPINTNTNAIASSALDVSNLTIGSTYITNNAAPSNGLLVQGRTLLGTSADNTVDQLQVSGNLNLVSVGNKLKIATGTNASIGTATLVAGTVTISTTAVTASSKIFITRNTTGGTIGSLSVPSTSITANTSFVINSDSASDTSTINWWVIN
ncbi:hypothetical protein BEL04_14520 [Mucilaginibacter sp. PPCGB 2223]|uniref:LamG domain-containing protein n=1 Tax=Mucilaginibacter sp. PPCGB 2223 TaxID=1886027 RepID=UPI00082580B8|nr:LamG domain-containing protein [Mucilaginibacter sp. PPCGB 2223]OCX52657.1 hypothetical protein BEL04_14520 [Mucilaginibacter sp. PPCGB 2223]